jgi:hypothetical protein
LTREHGQLGYTDEETGHLQEIVVVSVLIHGQHTNAIKENVEDEGTPNQGRKGRQHLRLETLKLLL